MATVKIKSIKQVGVKAVYDINVPKTSNFMANDVLVHNCDELDTLNGEGLRAIKEVAGMLDTKKGKKPLRIGISTRSLKQDL